MEAEVNDTIQSANQIAVNTQITGSLSKSSDVDWYKFEVPQDGVISLTFAHDFVDSSYEYWRTGARTACPRVHIISV